MGDLKSNGIFYHNKCWAKLKRDAETYKNKMVQIDKDDVVLKFRQKYCMRKVYQYVYERLYENPSACRTMNDFSRDTEAYVSKTIYMLIQISLISRTGMSQDLEIIKSSTILYVGWLAAELIRKDMQKLHFIVSKIWCALRN